MKDGKMASKNKAEAYQRNVEELKYKKRFGIIREKQEEWHKTSIFFLFSLFYHTFIPVPTGRNRSLHDFIGNIFFLCRIDLVGFVRFVSRVSPHRTPSKMQMSLTLTDDKGQGASFIKMHACSHDSKNSFIEVGQPISKLVCPSFRPFALNN